ncbi:tyrosine-type recombinase/integrase [Thioclava sp. F36-7]|uniref:tyrosine-type recombinase/integrase n=1 Tax=Thioclava sp. F36-7 TaxID=1915317 RepID=UPI001438F0EB|nr:tyrosine-type recombinase/integrase [Thioclava sp. F36-7]
MLHTDMEQVVTGIVQWKLRDEDRRRAIGLPRSPADAAREQRELAAATETLREAILLRNYDVVRDPIQHMLGKLGIEVQEGTEAWQELAHETTRALMDTTEEIARRDRGEFNTPSMFFRSAVRGADESPHVDRSPEHSAALERLLAIQPSDGTSNRITTAGRAANLTVTSGRDTQDRTAAPSSSTPSVEEKSAEPATTTADKASSTSTDAPSQAPSPQDSSESRREPPSSRDKAKASRGNSESKPDDLSPDLSATQIADLFLKHRQAGKSLNRRRDVTMKKEERTPQQMENETSTARLFSAYFGERKISDIDEDDCIDFFNLVVRLPSTYGKSSTHKTMHPEEVVKNFERDEKARLAPQRRKLVAEGNNEMQIEFRLKGERAPTMSANTVYRKMQEVQRIFEFARLFCAVSTNPMTEVIWSAEEHKSAVQNDGDRTRKIWGQHLPELFRTPHFQNFIDHPEDPLIWACLIGVFSGARLEEILQLKVEDFSNRNSQHLFAVNNGDQQSTKTASSKREVPIHDRLIELGLIDLLARRRDAGATWLFEGLERSRSRNKFSGVFTKMFTDFRKENGLYRELMDFHSFRKGFNQAMVDEDFSGEKRCAILGHVNNGINMRHYSDGFSLSAKASAVNSVDFDTSMLRNPFLDAKNAKVSNLTAERQRREFEARG